ncbi:uncharacterized protein EV420DRAFT_1487897 [Desarmillaria tabescens]|uniref:Uncharacterized protein n=1 Tax=Armillaria tabescens TaxID=1929756 RepID=A0AA39J3Y2_ARMTA|nr:uncharacterized protein EV420DRAFT_1487897 [Desarmillaria tabescens]KAK0435681.1 hypothetical protein EV420DRAFT_1487897 [Desarmillaria tabescens]
MRRDYADASANASRHVMLALLTNIRVQGQELEDIAMVGFQDGNMLMPMLDAKLLVITVAEKKAEEAHVQCRKFHAPTDKREEGFKICSTTATLTHQTLLVDS